MTPSEADEEKFSSGGGFIQFAVELGILCVTIRSKGARQEVGGLNQMIIHLKEADQNPGIDLSSHKEADQAPRALHFRQAFSNFFAVHLASRIENLARIIDRDPSLPQSVDSALAQGTASRFNAMSDAPFLKQRRSQRDSDGQGCGYRADSGPVRNHSLPPQFNRTVAIGAPA